MFLRKIEENRGDLIFTPPRPLPPSPYQMRRFEEAFKLHF